MADKSDVTSDYMFDNIPCDTNVINYVAVRFVAERLSARPANHRFSYQANSTDFVVSDCVYNERIVGRLVAVRKSDQGHYPRLGGLENCMASIARRQSGLFFNVYAQRSSEFGRIELTVPPLEYHDDNRIALSGSIVHEVRHAVDYARGIEMRKYGTCPSDAHEYVRHVTEARAFAEQIIYVTQKVIQKFRLPIIHAIQIVLAILVQPPWPMMPQMVEIAQRFLHKIAREKPEILLEPKENHEARSGRTKAEKCGAGAG